MNKISLSILFATSVLVACGNKDIDEAKKAIEMSLFDPSSAQYRNVNAFSDGVVCGEVNAKNRMGGYVGFEPFIFGGRRPGEVETNFVGTDEVKRWCSNDPKKRSVAVRAVPVPVPAKVPMAPPAVGDVVLTAHDSTWIQVTGADGVAHVRKTVDAGESVGVTGEMPLSVVIGRASSVQIQVKGKPFDITEFTKDNVARFQIK